MRPEDEPGEARAPQKYRRVEGGNTEGGGTDTIAEAPKEPDYHSPRGIWIKPSQIMVRFVTQEEGKGSFLHVLPPVHQQIPLIPTLGFV